DVVDVQEDRPALSLGGNVVGRGAGPRRGAGGQGQDQQKKGDPFHAQSSSIPSGVRGRSGSGRARMRNSRTILPPRRCSWRMRSRTGGSQWPYQTPSGETTAIGPPGQVSREVARPQETAP